MRFKLKHAALALIGLVTVGALASRLFFSPTPPAEPQGIVGVQVGVQVGQLEGVAVGVSSPANWTGNVVVSIGDSNDVGQGVAQGTGVDSEFDPAFDVMTAITAVPFNKHYAQSSNDPVPYASDVGGGVGPYAAAGVQNSGFQVPFAQEVTRAGYVTALWEHSISGIKATHAVWSAQQAAAGATGSTAVTFSLATLACGAIIGIKP